MECVQKKLWKNINMDKNTEHKNSTTEICNISDSDLENMIDFWLEHYIRYGDSHYNDTTDSKIREIYWDKIVGRVIEDVNIEMSDKEIEKFCDRLSNL